MSTKCGVRGHVLLPELFKYCGQRLTNTIRTSTRFAILKVLVWVDVASPEDCED